MEMNGIRVVYDEYRKIKTESFVQKFMRDARWERKDDTFGK